jgi:hypothetical protein
MKNLPMTKDVAKTCEKKLQDCLQSLLDLHLPSVNAENNRVVSIYDDTRLMCDKFADVYALDTELVEDVNPVSVKGVEISLPDVFVRNTSNMVRCFAFPMFKSLASLERPSLLLLFMFGQAGKQAHIAAYAEQPDVELGIYIVRTCETLVRLGSFLDDNLVSHGTSADADSLLEQLRANDMPVSADVDDTEEFDLDANLGDDEEFEDEDDDDGDDDLTD